METIIWHNPSCGTSRKVLAGLTAAGITPEVVLYLKTPPDAARIRAVLAAMGQPASALLRQKEPLAQDLGLTGADVTEEQLIEAMASHPVLIERPVVIRGNRAVLARPPERLDEFLAG